MPDLCDRIVSLQAIEVEFEAKLLIAAMQSDVDGAMAVIFQFLVSRKHWIDPRIESAAAEIKSCDGMISMRELVSSHHMSTRSFQARLKEHVGLTAKEFSRIRRLQATIRRLDVSAVDTAETAAKGGFADQAHATREMKRVAATTPARLRAALRDDRGADCALRLTAAFIRGRFHT